LKVWRLARRRFAPTAAAAYSGEGAALRGGRWNSRGVRIAYASTNEGLALVEYLVHLDIAYAPTDLVFYPAELPDDAVENVVSIPDGWDVSPPSRATADVGDIFVAAAKHLALRVPSAVLPFAWNVMINPDHHRFREIAFDDPVPFTIDERLLRRLRP
jgi:RES domain-containing protein